MSERVLVLGSGGREHALAWKLLQSPKVDTVFVAPGNGGTHGDGLVSVEAADPIRFVKEHGIALTVVGPEAPLADGLVDRFRAAGLRCAGPIQAAARLEASKAWSKQQMREAGVPTAASGCFTDLPAALRYIESVDHLLVVKASGLAAGKGVVVCDSVHEAREAARDILEGGAFGQAGAEVVIEERLEGEEASLLAFCDGENLAVLPAAQDHKRIGEGDVGLNTGGMGAYTPAPVIADRMDEMVACALQPMMDHLRASGTPFTGVLYAGLMLTPNGPRILEYNVRFGDPETQVLLPMLNADLFDLFMGTVEGGLDRVPMAWHTGAAATVVAASEGYPKAYTKGHEIHGVEEANRLDGVTVFHAGTRRDGQVLRTSGGRVLAVTGRGDTLQAALDRAYAGIQKICFHGITYRRDIGHRALARRGGQS